MAEIKTIYKGESISLLFTFPEAYDMARLTSQKVFVGETEFAGVKDGQTVKLQLKSSDTDRMIGTHKVVLWFVDTTLGLRKPYCGDLVVAKTQAAGNTVSVSSISDIIIPIIISETAVTVGDILYNYVKGKSSYEVWLETHEGTLADYEAFIKGDPFLYADFTPEQLEALKVKGDKGDSFEYADFTPEQIATLQQPATDAASSVHEVERVVEQAEGLRATAESGRVTAEGLRVTAESNRTGAELLRTGAESDRSGAELLRAGAEDTREGNEEDREQAEALRVQAEIDRQTNTGTAIQNAETATQNANDAATLANTKAALANDAAALANTKAELADTAATNANTKAGLADTAATNADNARLAIQADLALKENTANKQNSLATDGTGVKLVTVDAVNGELICKEKYINPLNIVPSDMNPSVTHPSIVKIDGGFNGYAYWMVYTPFPPDNRENPHILASNDGMNWHEPEGINNPVVTFSHIQSLGYGYNSDANLVYGNGKLELYYRLVKTTEEAIYKVESIDGINWVNETFLLIGARSTLLSPSVAYDSGYKLWVADTSNALLPKLVLYESSDGLTFTKTTDCTVSGLERTSAFIWHFEVRKINTTYYLIGSEYNSWVLVFAKSTDGINWVIEDINVFNRSGEAYDLDGFYKATFAPTYGNYGILFDMWVATVNKNGSTSVNSPTSLHKIAYYKNVDLMNGNNKVAIKDVQRLWIAPKDFADGVGTNQLLVQNTIVPYIKLTKSYAKIVASVLIPKYFKKINIKVYWANLSTSSGNVLLTSENHYRKAGNLVTVDDVIFSVSKILPTASQYVIVATELSEVMRNIRTVDDEFIIITLLRNGTNVNDTLVGDVAIYGIEIEGRIEL